MMKAKKIHVNAFTVKTRKIYREITDTVKAAD
jgi:hypothetical protein